MKKILVLSLLFFPFFSFGPKEEDFAQLRKGMVEGQIIKRDVTDTRVLEVMREVPRHKFVSSRHLSQAYADHPLPIGYGQTISQPYIVALMTQALRLKGGERVLEVGAGSGYQAAILARLCEEVWAVEIIEELTDSAQQRLEKLGFKNVKVKNADGYYGWEEYAPFDRIMVTCAPDHIPAPLIAQLKEGGIMVIPVGPAGSYQTLWQIEKKEGKIYFSNLGGVIFVPLTRR